jgi:hypothetical protein
MQVKLRGSLQTLKLYELLKSVNPGYIDILKNNIQGYCGLFGKKVANRIIIKF